MPKCNQVDCDLPATHYYVWHGPEMSCEVHARAAVGLGDFMCFNTPRLTLRRLTMEEMLDQPAEGGEGEG